MAFLEERLSPAITEGAQGGPTVPGRTLVRYPDGRVEQNFTAEMPIHKYDVSHGIKTAAQFQTVLDLWYVVMMTPYEGFRFKDWRDFRGTAANTTLTLISGTTYQLQRKYVFGPTTFKRDITKPVSDVAVYDASNGLLTSSTDTTTGIVTVPTGVPAYWIGEFDVPVFFADDEWMGELHGSTSRLYVGAGSIKLEELK